MPFAAWIGLALPAVKDGEDRRGLPDAVDFCCFSLAPSQEISIMSRACESTSLGDISAESIVSCAILSILLLNCESSLGMHADGSMLVIAGHGFFSTDKMAAVSHACGRSSIVVCRTESGRRPGPVGETAVSRADGGTRTFIGKINEKIKKEKKDQKSK